MQPCYYSNEEEKVALDRWLDVLNRFNSVMLAKGWSFRDLCMAAGVKPTGMASIFCLLSTYQITDLGQLNYYLNRGIPPMKGSTEERTATYAENLKELADIFEPVLDPDCNPDFSNDIERLILNYIKQENINADVVWSNKDEIRIHTLDDAGSAKIRARFPNVKIDLMELL